ncbi:HD domain-containing protein [Actinobacteria bacterium YIM 96077]|uniref:Phosphohydrolase n=2 Tax=Phytoactinopolyspora halophila TaxID=1981511 RepID=A0A329R0H5_9ACTN|nr:HD domain-containing protein [Actinobacteria bacterium YIM 96077]RAW17656.1 phosphohydrolase [Phytoactinopolyspora halophila]
MSSMGDRWAHVLAVGSLAAKLAAQTRHVPDVVVAAAWLHDIGYAPHVRSSGFHPVDGADFLAARHAPSELVSLVAYHSGAAYEAEERGLAAKLAAFGEPEQTNLDMLTLVDMSTGPTGIRVSVHQRLAEILTRYDTDHPVHRAITRSRESLIESCVRAARLLDLSDEWVFAPV